MSLIYSQSAVHVFERPLQMGGKMYVFTSLAEGAAFEVPGQHLNRLLPALKWGGWEGVKRAMSRIERDTWDAYRAFLSMGFIARNRLAQTFRAWAEWFGEGRGSHFWKELSRYDKDLFRK